MHESLRAGQRSEPPTLRGGDGVSRTKDSRPERSETGVWVGIFAIIMSFAAFTSAMIVRQGASADWRHFEIPKLLYGNTLILLGSSLTLGMASKSFGSVARLLESAPSQSKSCFSEGMNWLQVTLGLGGLFVIGQFLAWRVLVAQGLLLSTNPSASFFYVFTAMHAVHLLGGIAGLIYMIRKLSKTNGTAQTTGLRAMCTYWHFMDGLWIYLLLILLVRT